MVLYLLSGVIMAFQNSNNILYQVIALSTVATLRNSIKIKVKIKAKNLGQV